MNRVYVTTSIPYVNGRPHVGFALELVQADVLARYYRLLGGKVRLQTGADENAYKNVLSAREQGVSTQELVDCNSALFRTLAGVLNIAVDDFLRTTETRHKQAVQTLWQSLRDGDLYQRRYRGLYCAGCEDFYQPRDLQAGLCPDHGTRPQQVEEQNWFFRLSAYQQQLEELIDSGRLLIRPESRRNEVLGFVRRGLEDISVSRDSARLEGWGVPVPGDERQIIYVWIDALINYLSGPGYGGGDAWREWWNGDGGHKIHCLGKNVWKFHAIYWPALLLSAGLPLPDELLVHGFFTENGRKISKSRGISIDPFDCVARFGADGVRYFLLRGIGPFADGDFSIDRLQALYNSDLANGLGNLVSRLTALAQRAGYCLPAEQVREFPAGYQEALQARAFDQALALLWRLVAGLNRQIEEVRPWELTDGLEQHLQCWFGELRRIAYALRPLLPTAAGRIEAALIGGEVVIVNDLFPRLT